MNHVVLIGRLGKDPELRYTATGKAVANVTLATTEKYKDKEQTTWHQLIVWGNQAEALAKHMKKGCRLGVVGKIGARKFTARDGSEKTVVEVIAHEIEFLSFPTESHGQGQADTPPLPDREDRSVPDGFDPNDEIPF